MASQKYDYMSLKIAAQYLRRVGEVSSYVPVDV